MSRPSIASRVPARALVAAVAVLPAAVMAIVVLLRHLDGSASVGIGLIGVVVLLIVGCGLAALVAEQLSVATPASGAAVPALSGDRDVLIAACVELGDLVPSESLRRRVRGALEQVGVHAVEVEQGATFDAAGSRVVDRVPTSDPGLNNRVARTERVGYVDRGHPLREPEVVVYTVERGSHG
jgi:hypothetical protein